MKKRLFRLSWVSFLLGGLALAGWTGCASTQVRDTENMLAAAGFQTKTATTPEEQAHLSSLKPHQMLRTMRDGQVMYVYADPKGCNCVYIGNEQQHAEFERMATEKQIADENLMAAEDVAAGPLWW